MPINVTCTGCHKRFTVPDKFAGQRGPCPGCKTVILIPKPEDEVVIHGGEADQVKGADGRKVLKPLSRTSLRLSRMQLFSIGGGILFVLLISLSMRFLVEDPDKFPIPLLVVGAALLALPVSLGGYIFLQNDELGSFPFGTLLVRAGICAVAYISLWGVYAFLPSFMDMNDSSIAHLGTAALCLLMGAIAPWAALDFEYGDALMHCGFYIVVSVALCWIMGAQSILWVAAG